MYQDHAVAWDQCLSIIKESISPNSFTTWFQPITPVDLTDHKLTIELPNQFFFDFLEGHYSLLLSQVVLQTLGEAGELNYNISVNGNSGINPLPTMDKKPHIKRPDNIVERYTFDSFVEGSNNQFARAAALAVSDAPGKTTFNPLVIYGGVGLGKTHLIQAIANHSIMEKTSPRVLYVESEKFTIEFINAIQTHKTTEFSGIYRNVDLLIVDDIQFFTNKERTQEEFFHTFNSLYNSGKQIVLSSDRPPKDLVGVEERLISRFQWGLVVDIQAPDLETRIAILQQKAGENEMDIDSEIIEFIAVNVTSNIRELEGSLIRLLAHASLTGTDITLESAKSVLKNLSLGKKKKILVEEIQRIACDHFEIPEDLLRAKTRKKEIVYVRQLAMYLTKELTKNSLTTIGLHFGGRDHSTVIHAVQTVERQIKKDTQTREDVEELKRKIDRSTI